MKKKSTKLDPSPGDLVQDQMRYPLSHELVATIQITLNMDDEDCNRSSN